MLKKNIIVKTQFEALHNWETCNLPEVEFLKYPHRHKFFVTAKISVTDNDRELEFFTVKKDLDSFLNIAYANQLNNNTSCEMMAENIIEFLSHLGKRDITVIVMEDDENGAELTWVE